MRARRCLQQRAFYCRLQRARRKDVHIRKSMASETGVRTEGAGHRVCAPRQLKRLPDRSRYIARLHDERKVIRAVLTDRVML